MRRAWTLAALVVLVAGATPWTAGADSGHEFRQLLIDPTNDAFVSATIPGIPNADPRAEFQYLELLETHDQLAFRFHSYLEMNVPESPGTAYSSALYFTYVTTGADALHDIQIHANGAEFRFMRDGTEVQDPEIFWFGTATSYTFEAPKRLFTPNHAPGALDRLEDINVKLLSSNSAGSTSDVAPNSGITSHELTGGLMVPNTDQWIGPQDTTGVSVAVDADNRTHYAFVRFCCEGDPGLYYGRGGDVEGDQPTADSFEADRMADVLFASASEDSVLPGTSLALDDQGKPRILFFARVAADGGDPVYAEQDEEGRWRFEALNGSAATKAVFGGSAQSVPQLAIGGGRTVAALQAVDAESSPKIVVLERRGPADWVVLTMFPSARFGHIGADHGGNLHMAWYEPGKRDADEGRLVYANSSSGWTQRVFEENVTVNDEGGYVDDGLVPFDLAVTPWGEAYVTWADAQDEVWWREMTRGSGPMEIEAFNVLPHRTKVAVDWMGNLHFLTGYGSTWQYTLRSVHGHEVENMYYGALGDVAVSPSGFPAMATLSGDSSNEVYLYWFMSSPFPRDFAPMWATPAPDVTENLAHPTIPEPAVPAPATVSAVDAPPALDPTGMMAASALTIVSIGVLFFLRRRP